MLYYQREQEMGRALFLILYALSTLYVSQGDLGYAYCSYKGDWSHNYGVVPYQEASSQCQERCHTAGYKYYGVMRNSEFDSYATCFCGDSRESQCSGSCDYDCDGPCGGGGLDPLCVSVYSAGSSFPQCTNDSWSYLLSTNGDNAVLYCTDQCRYQRSYSFAGVRRDGGGSTVCCYCSDSHPNSNLSSSYCGFECGGLPCGDYSTMSTYPVCLEGYYGSSCQYSCRGSCISYICDVTTGECPGECMSGYYGHHCDIYCPINCIMDKCRQADGFCEVGCKSNFYGDKCEYSCPQHCHDDLCEQSTGYCTGCDERFYGNTCDLTCSVNCYNNICSQSDGTCDGGCDDGWYMPTCNEQCPTQCTGSQCDITSGQCFSCLSGWYGEDCNIRCSNGCRQTTCTQTGGVCDGGCADGWFTPTCTVQCPIQCTERRCDITTGLCFSCNSGWYGERCSKECPSNCNESDCEYTSGQCVYGCIPGYYSDTCQTECPVNCETYSCTLDGQCLGCDDLFCNQSFGCDALYCNQSSWCDSLHCNQSLCHFETGACTLGCKEGWNGTKCNDDIDECSEYPDICAKDVCFNSEGSYSCYPIVSDKIPIWVGPVIAAAVVFGLVVGFFIRYLTHKNRNKPQQTTPERVEEEPHIYVNQDFVRMNDYVSHSSNLDLHQTTSDSQYEMVTKTSTSKTDIYESLG